MLSTNESITDYDFFKYPNIETFRTKLIELSQLDLGSANKDFISQTLFEYLPVLPSLISKYSVSKFNAFNFYRVRLNIDDLVEDLSLSRTYSYPPAQFCKENGRANMRNRSVFYSTNSALTAVLESRPSVGDVGYLSVWKGYTDREIKSGVLLPRDLIHENEWSLVAKDAYEFADKHVKKVGLRKRELFHEALNFIARLYLTENAPYPLTSFISNEFLYGSAWKDMLIYPSVANDAYSTNIAIHPNVVDNYLRIVKVHRFKVVKMDKTGLGLSTGRVGEIVNNSIEWRNATKEESNFIDLPG